MQLVALTAIDLEVQRLKYNEIYVSFMDISDYRWSQASLVVLLHEFLRNSGFFALFTSLIIACSIVLMTEYGN